MNKDKNTRKKYLAHRSGSKKRNIEFNLTYDEWCDIWKESGKWELRGVGKGKYCMCRLFDKGSYSKDNVYIALSVDNINHYHKYQAFKSGFKDCEGKYNCFNDREKAKYELNPANLLDEDQEYMPKYG